MNGNGRSPVDRGIQRGDWVMVTQTMLREYQFLVAQAKRLRALRARLILLLKVGAPVQPGPLTATITRKEVCRLTRAKLAALIGETQVEIYVRNIAPSESTSLDVREV